MNAKRWSPSTGLGSIKAQSKPLFSMPSWSFDPDNVIEDSVYGAITGAAPFTIGPLGSNAEIKLAAGLGLTGLVWAFTGRNYFAISGAVTSLGAYALLKMYPPMLEVKPGGVQIQPFK